MKKMKMSVLSLTMILSSTALMNVAGAAESRDSRDSRDSSMPSEMDFSGTTPARLNYTGFNGGKGVACAATFWFFGGFCWDNYDAGHWEIGKSSGKNVDSTVLVKTWGEGKVLVNYALESAESCAGIQKTYVGYATAYQSYNLYELSGTKIDVNPATTEPAATLSITTHGAVLKLFRDITASTQDSSGDTCNWGIWSDTALNFKLDSGN